jgi:hypothetical protein
MERVTTREVCRAPNGERACSLLNGLGPYLYWIPA